MFPTLLCGHSEHQCVIEEVLAVLVRLVVKVSVGDELRPPPSKKENSLHVYSISSGLVHPDDHHYHCKNSVTLYGFMITEVTMDMIDTVLVSMMTGL